MADAVGELLGAAGAAGFQLQVDHAGGDVGHRLRLLHLILHHLKDIVVHLFRECSCAKAAGGRIFQLIQEGLCEGPVFPFVMFKGLFVAGTGEECGGAFRQLFCG